MGEHWFAETEWGGFEQRFQVRRTLWSGRSAFQQIDVLETVPFGRALVLDGALQTTEADEFCYHEMLVHLPLLAHPNPRRVLIVGGGDGGALRHVLMHPVARVDQVEIDELVVQACRAWLPALGGEAFDDPRVRLVFDDGLAHLRATPDPYDVIIVDSTDPIGPAEGLISEEFFVLAASRLAAGGLFAMQTGSPVLMRRELALAASRVGRAFGVARTYLGHVLSYPGVVWSYTIGSADRDPTRPVRSPTFPTRYYSAELHAAAFALPRYVQLALQAGPDGVADVRGPILG